MSGFLSVTSNTTEASKTGIQRPLRSGVGRSSNPWDFQLAGKPGPSSEEESGWGLLCSLGQSLPLLPVLAPVCKGAVNPRRGGGGSSVPPRKLCCVKAWLLLGSDREASGV